MLEDAIRRAFRDRLRVEVRGSDYKFEGTLQAVFMKRSGVMRVVVEDDNRVLHVESPRALCELPAAPSSGKCSNCGSTNVRTQEGYDLFKDKKVLATLCLECVKVRSEYVE